MVCAGPGLLQGHSLEPENLLDIISEMAYKTERSAAATLTTKAVIIIFCQCLSMIV